VLSKGVQKGFCQEARSFWRVSVSYGGLLGGSVCAFRCSALGAGQEAIDRALGACIWKRHVSKGLKILCSNKKKRRGGGSDGQGPWQRRLAQTKTRGALSVGCSAGPCLC